MSEKIGSFEIVSQLAQSPFATVYKAVDTNNQQTVALKVVRLSEAKDRAEMLKRVFEEAEQAKPLSSHNIAALYGVGDEGDLLLAATEYIQGNSVATTLTRHEGFSIWDLQDIARQVCHALDHAQVHKVVHHSLEPAKIMVQWDGMVKVLGFGISNMSSHALASPGEGVCEILYYASPEQLRGDACDHRSALFSLGSVLYEMATEQKPFAGETAEQVREAILDKLPVQPTRLKANLNRGLSDLIMKALSKNPDERYQSGQELVHDLEQCKAGASPIGSVPATPAAAVKSAVSTPKPKASAAAAGAGAGLRSATAPPPKMSASIAPAAEEESPNFAVDPMMAGEDAVSARKSASFSDISELPPLKEAPVDSSFSPTVDEPEESPEAELPPPAATLRRAELEKAKVQVREVAQKAAKEIRKTPPKLYLSFVGGAVALVGLIIGGLMLRNYFEDRDEGSPTNAIQQITGAQNDSAPAEKPAAPVAQTPQQATQMAEPTAPPAAEQTEPLESNPSPSAPAGRGKKGKSRAAVPAVTVAQLSVGTTPDGAQITFDGSALCQSPCTLTGIAAGTHTVVASKPGFGSVTRNLALASGANASVALQLTQSQAILSVSSTPAGAVILIDGKDSGKLTPSQFTFDKAGAHTVTLRRVGYLDGSSSVNAEPGQTSNVNLTLTHLGNTDEIRAAGGKFKKVFGRGDASGMGTVSVKTQPKGAQIMVNNRVLDKTSPFDFYLNPGTYVLDITMSGYRAIHRVISVQEGEKLAIEESLQPE